MIILDASAAVQMALGSEVGRALIDMTLSTEKALASDIFRAEVPGPSVVKLVAKTQLTTIRREAMGLTMVPCYELTPQAQDVFTLNKDVYRTGSREEAPGSVFVENLRYLFLPSLALSLSMVALIARITRSNMIEQLNAPYATTAVAKGIPYWKVVLKHCFKNAIIPVVTVASLQFGTMIVGAVLVENVFALGGLGDVLISSIKASDYPVVQGCVLIIALCVCVMNLIVDLVYGFIDPRVMAQYTAGSRKKEKAPRPTEQKEAA